MTREEAIKHLHTFSTTMGSGQTTDEQHEEAKHMAIEALSADTVSREVYDKRTQADEKIIDSYRQEFQKALSAEAVEGDAKSATTTDLISREAAREAIEKLMEIHFDRQVVLAKARDTIVSLPSAVCDDCIWTVCNYNKVDWDAPSSETVQEWIPIKYHEITESERKENGYPKDWVYFLDCEMPQDEQEILVQAKNGEIRWDVCYEDDGFSLDSGWDWKDDIIAWMPLPEPYREDGE